MLPVAGRTAGALLRGAVKKFSKKHWELVADELYSTRGHFSPKESYLVVCGRLADMFAKHGTDFDRARFLERAGAHI